MPACARMGDPHACPITGHGITPIIMGSPNTHFDGQPAACVGHKTACGATIVVGFPKFTVNGLPVAYMGSPTTHGGLVIAGSPDIFAASMGGNPIDFQKMGAIDEAGELNESKMAELLADPGLESKALMAGATVNLEAQTFHFLDPVMSIFNRRAAEIPALSTTMARLSKQLKNEGHKHLDADQHEQGPPTKEEQDEDQLIVQVVGKEHNDDQRIAIFDECDNRLGKTEERTKEPFHYQTTRTEETGIDNELHIWPWPKEEPERVLKLEVQAENGDPIQLPLMDKAISTYKRTARQCNVICPIVPASLVENVRPSQYSDSHIAESHSDRANNSVLAKARTGFFYIFVNGRLWRELEIKQEEQEGKLTTYHDVRLSTYREGPNPDDPFKEPSGEDKGKREAEGKGLKDIWVPIQWNQRKQKIEVMYAEVQLPAERINRFERDPKLRKRRTQPINLNIVEARVEHEKYKKDIILGDCMPKVRPRSDVVEWTFNFPAAYLLCLHGAHPYQAYKKAKGYIDRHGDPKTYHDHYLGVTKLDPQGGSDNLIGYRYAHNLKIRKHKDEEPHLESGALTVLVQKALFEERASQRKREKVREAQIAKRKPNYRPTAEEKKAKAEKEALYEKETKKLRAEYEPDKEFWTKGHLTISESEEAFYDARTRRIGVIQVEDSIYRARLLKERLIAQKALLEHLANLAESRPHHKSAILMDRYLAPEKIGGHENPFYNDFKSIHAEGRSRLGYTLLKSERALVTKYMHEIQEEITTWMRSHFNQYSLADFFSLSGVDYMGAFKLTLELIQWAALPLHTLNPEDGDIIKKDTPSAQKWLFDLVIKRIEPLYAMLYPETSLDILKSPYVIPEQDENLGDGLFRGKEIAELMEIKKYTGPAETLDGIFLSSLDSLNDLDYTWAKNFNAFLCMLHSNYYAVVQTSVENVSGVKDEINQNRHLLDKALLDEKPMGNDAKRSKAKVIKKLQKSLGDLSGKWIDLMSAEINRQRGFMPDALGEMVYAVTNGEDLKDKYVISLRADPSYRVKKLFSEVYEIDSNNNLKKVMSTEGLDEFNQKYYGSPELTEHHVMILNKNNRLAQTLSYTNKLITEYVMIMKSEASIKEQIRVSTHATPHLQQQLKICEQEKIRLENTMKNDPVFPGIGKTVHLPLVIISIELINLFCNEIGNREGNIESKGITRAIAGIAGAVVDTTIALEILASKMADNNILTRVLNIGKDTPPSWWKRTIPLISDKWAKRLVRRISVGSFLGFAAGALLAITNAMDACYEWNRRNYGAAIGFGMVSVGAFIGMVSLLFQVQATLSIVTSIPYIGSFLGLVMASQVGLIVFILIVVGTAIAMYFDKSQLEMWLDNGPFSRNPEESDYKHLTDNEYESFYRLFSLLVRPSIEIDVIPESRRKAFDSPNAVIRVHNPLRSMGATIDNKDTLDVKVNHDSCRAARQLGTHYYYGNNSMNRCMPSSTRELPILKSKTFGDYNEYYVHIMSGCDERMCPYSDAKRRNRIDQLKVWAQVYYYTLEADEKWIRPCPGLDPLDPITQLSIEDIEDYTNEDSEKFWVRENKHQVRKALDDYLNKLEKELEPA